MSNPEKWQRFKELPQDIAARLYSDISEDEIR
jgi:hypothetical protein